jgi:hypothetical protein
MIGRDLDFDLHNAIQELIAEGLSSTTGMTRLLLRNRPFLTLS